jgi:deoxycytidylate deaminase
MAFSDKTVKKYMRLAKQVGEDQNHCYSRNIGSLVVRVYDDGSSKILGTGYNSPPTDVPHCDSREYLREIFWPQLTTNEKDSALLPLLADKPDLLTQFHQTELKDEVKCEMLCDHYSDKKICPRKVINAPSGKRLELCSCAHSETNAIVNSSDDLHGAYMFCWCPVPCYDCSKLIINSRIKRVYCWTAEKDYSFGSRWLLRNGGVELIEHPQEYYLS